MTSTRSTLMYRLAQALPILMTLAAPLAAHAQNSPVTGTMMQTDGQPDADAAAARQQSEAVAGRERALQEQAMQRQAAEQTAQQRARQPAPPVAAPSTQPATGPSVVRQLPNPAAPQAAAAQAAPQAALQAAPPRSTAPAPVPQPTITGTPPVGDVSRSALAMQADGRYAGPAVPTLGATTRATWDRYVQSFRTPIPEFYPTNSSPKN